MQFICAIYQILSPYIQIAFTALLAYYSFLEQFLLQSKNEKINRVQNQKDLLNKEIFDEIQKKVADSYSSLSSVKVYVKLFENHKLSNSLIFFIHCNTFPDKHLDLQDKLNFLYSTCEKYDFIIDPELELIIGLSKASTEILDCCSKVAKATRKIAENHKQGLEISKDIQDDLNQKLAILSDSCSKINMHVQKISEASKQLLKDVISSLDKQVASYRSHR
jgi:hypothetical protein